MTRTGSVLISVIFLFMLTPLIVNSVHGAQSQPIIADHTTCDLSGIPKSAIENAKSTLHIAYGHTSHGSQLTEGMTGLAGFANARYGGALYAWNSDGSGGALDLRDMADEDLGNPDRSTWASTTRKYLKAHPEVNVVMWSWCGQVADSTKEEIDTYLSLMSQLEAEFPGVRFVYMTGHLDGSGTDGNLNTRNEQIRQYCREHGKVLYDFADIESYDPDGNGYLARGADDGCNYDDGGRNWAIDWQKSHREGVDWYRCDCSHSEPLNCNRKAYAAWWLFARLAGWEG